MPFEKKPKGTPLVFVEEIEKNGMFYSKIDFYVILIKLHLVEVEYLLFKRNILIILVCQFW